jgi:hypothetical protein
MRSLHEDLLGTFSSFPVRRRRADGGVNLRRSPTRNPGGCGGPAEGEKGLGRAGGTEGEGKGGLGWRSDPVLELGQAAMVVAAASSGAARVSKERKRGEGRDRRGFL